MGYQKFRSSEVEKLRSSYGVSKVQMFRNSTNSTYSEVLRSSEVQKFHKFTTSRWAKLFLHRAMPT
jgi:hypothetical protein